MDAKCPGNDQSKWKPEDIQFLTCQSCGKEVEIWKDEPLRFCPACQKPVRNPRFSMDCEAWCQSASECPGVKLKRATGDDPASGDDAK